MQVFVICGGVCGWCACLVGGMWLLMLDVRCLCEWFVEVCGVHTGFDLFQYVCAVGGYVCGSYKCAWCVAVAMVCGGVYGLWRCVWFVEEYMVCGGVYGLWGSIRFVEECTVCGGVYGLWRCV